MKTTTNKTTTNTTPSKVYAALRAIDRLELTNAEMKILRNKLNEITAPNALRDIGQEFITSALSNRERPRKLHLLDAMQIPETVVYVKRGK